MKAQFLPLFNVNLSQLQLNSTSTQFQLNFDSISSQPHFNLRFKSTSASISTSTITSAQYGCDIKATQSCYANLSIITIWTRNRYCFHETAIWVSFRLKKLILRCSNFTKRQNTWRIERQNSKSSHYFSCGLLIKYNNFCFLGFVQVGHLIFS